MHIQQLSIIGVGLIGGSLARALKQARVCQQIVGYGRNLSHLQHAVELGVIDRYTNNPIEAVEGAEIVVVAVPLGTMATLFKAILPGLSQDVVITDVGSAKATVVADAQAELQQHFTRFVPGHPIAGNEKSGVTASFPELFKNRRVILTPTSTTARDAYAKVAAMWAQTGAEVIEMSVQHHDEVLAATSHLPHLIAYSLVDTLAQMDENREIFQYAAGGFRDFTRIASSDPQMWHDICVANREEILKVLEYFHADLNRLVGAIQQGDSDLIKQTFSRAKITRDNFIQYL